MESQKTEKINPRRLLITIGIVLLTAVIVGGTTWYVMDRNYRALEQENSLSNAGAAVSTFCTGNGLVSEEDLLNFVKNLPGLDDVRIEEQDGSKFLVIGYVPIKPAANWADVSYPLDCLTNAEIEENNAENETTSEELDQQ
jgi:hypothetical protein